MMNWILFEGVKGSPYIGDPEQTTTGHKAILLGDMAQSSFKFSTLFFSTLLLGDMGQSSVLFSLVTWDSLQWSSPW